MGTPEDSAASLEVLAGYCSVPLAVASSPSSCDHLWKADGEMPMGAGSVCRPERMGRSRFGLETSRAR